MTDLHLIHLPDGSPFGIATEAEIAGLVEDGILPGGIVVTPYSVKAEVGL